jgi:hypothetical protein
VRSRRAGSRPKRRKVSPLVGLVERVRVVCGVGSIDLGCALPRQEGGQRFIDKRRIRKAGADASRARE